jgi:hypothetical protein
VDRDSSLAKWPRGPAAWPNGHVGRLLGPTHDRGQPELPSYAVRARRVQGLVTAPRAPVAARWWSPARAVFPTTTSNTGGIHPARRGGRGSPEQRGSVKAGRSGGAAVSRGYGGTPVGNGGVGRLL